MEKKMNEEQRAIIAGILAVLLIVSMGFLTLIL
jgi:hypothetical protein